MLGPRTSLEIPVMLAIVRTPNPRELEPEKGVRLIYNTFLCCTSLRLLIHSFTDIIYTTSEDLTKTSIAKSFPIHIYGMSFSMKSADFYWTSSSSNASGPPVLAPKVKKLEFNRPIATHQWSGLV